jgi:hypothetical protein
MAGRSNLVRQRPHRDLDKTTPRDSAETGRKHRSAPALENASTESGEGSSEKKKSSGTFVLLWFILPAVLLIAGELFKK